MNIVRAIKGAAFRGIMAAEPALCKECLPLAEIKNFLVLQHATALGSVVHATPLIAALKSAIPECKIVVAASGMSVEIYREHPDIAAIVKTPTPLKDMLGAALALRRSNPFRGQTFATITPVANERTRVALSAVMACASNRVGFTLAPELYRSPLELDREISVIANNLRIIGALGHTLPIKNFDPQVFFNAKDLDFAHRILAEAHVKEGQPVAVFVTQTSVTQRKSWRPERFRAAAKSLRAQWGAHIIFVGTSAEGAAIDSIRDGISFPTTSVAGKTSLTELTALLSRCDIGLTLDTGTMHLGRAVDLPMVIVAPAWSPPVEWLPIGDARFRILKNLDLKVAGPDYVIDEVCIDEVTAALSDLLNQYPPGNRRSTG